MVNEIDVDGIIIVILYNLKYINIIVYFLI